MANTYQFNVLTVDGAALIAQATAANPIVYVGALSRATAAASAAELATAPASWYTGKAGEIVAVSATGNVAEIRAVWRNAGQSQLAKSVAITARLASQSDAQAVVITAMSDPDATIVLPGSTDTGAGVAIPFYVQIGATGSVEVTPGACASIADLDRFVSIHAAGNSNAGEAQTVRGAKTFSDDATFSGGVGVAGALSVGGNVSSWGGISADGPLSVGAGAAITGGVSVAVPSTAVISTDVARAGTHVEFLQQNKTSGDGGAKFLFQFRNEIPGQADVVYAWDMRDTSLTNAAATISVYSVTASTASFSGTVSVGGLSGLAPAWDADAQAYIVPVGGTIPAFVKDTAIQNPSWGVGLSFTLAADDARIADWNGSFVAGQYSLGAGTYATLTAGTKQSTTGYVNYMILMRIS